MSLSDEEDVSTDPSDYSDLEYESSSPTKSTTNKSIKLQSVHDTTNSTKPPSIDDCKGPCNVSKSAQTPLQKALDNEVKSPKKESGIDADSDRDIDPTKTHQNLPKLEASSTSNTPPSSDSKRHELASESLDFLLAKTLCIHPSLRWNIDWCRYCGARASAAFGKSPWGPQQLCHKHHTQWIQDELNLSRHAEPLNVDSVINKSECTEKEYLIDILMGYGEDMDLKHMVSNSTCAKRRSWRIQNQDIKKQMNDEEDEDDEEDYDSDIDMNGSVFQDDGASPSDSDQSWYSSAQNGEEEDTEENDDDEEYEEDYNNNKGVNGRRKRLFDELKCRDCEKVFVSSTSYQYHCSEEHDNDKPFYCTQCPKTYQAAGGLDYHIRKIHEKEINFHCKWCDKPFFNKSELKLHHKTHQKKKKPPKPTTFPCPHCDRLFGRKYYLKRHVINIHMQNQDKPYQCQYCTYGAATKKQIIWHENIHRNERKFKCEICGKTFNNDVDVRKHTANNHTKPFKCQICDRGFGTRNYLKMHMIHRHTPNKDKPYQCEHCDYGSGSLKSVQKHQRVHTKEMPFKCGQCGRTFKLLNYLHNHIAKMHEVAEEDKKFKCNLCNKRFNSKKYLTNHVQCHAHQDTFLECDKCEYSTSFEERLERHRTVHSGDKPYQCEICHQRFRLKSYVQTHMKARHADVKLEYKTRNNATNWNGVKLPKKPKDSNCPRKPLNSFFLFQIEVRKNLKRKDRYMVSQAEVAKEIGRRWQALSETAKQKYKDEEYKLRERYNYEMEQYRHTKEYKKYRQKVKEWERECKEKKARMMRKFNNAYANENSKSKVKQQRFASDSSSDQYTDSESDDSEGSSYSD